MKNKITLMEVRILYKNTQILFKFEASNSLRNKSLGAPGWLSHLASAFGSGHDPRVLGWSPASGFLLCREPASPSPPRLYSLTVSPSLSNK